MSEEPNTGSTDSPSKNEEDALVLWKLSFLTILTNGLKACVAGRKILAPGGARQRETRGQARAHKSSLRSRRQMIVIYRPLRGLVIIADLPPGFRAARSTRGYNLTPAPRAKIAG